MIWTGWYRENCWTELPRDECIIVLQLGRVCLWMRRWYLTSKQQWVIAKVHREITDPSSPNLKQHRDWARLSFLGLLSKRKTQNSLSTLCCFNLLTRTSACLLLETTPSAAVILTTCNCALLISSLKKKLPGDQSEHLASHEYGVFSDNVRGQQPALKSLPSRGGKRKQMQVKDHGSVRQIYQWITHRMADLGLSCIMKEHYNSFTIQNTRKNIYLINVVGCYL